MKKSYLVIIFILFISFFSGYSYYKTIQKQIPQDITKSNETILNVDKVRFTFKIEILSNKALNSILFAKIFKNEDYIDDAINYFEASIAFSQMNYTKDNKISNFVVPRVENIIHIIENNRLNINNTQLKEIKNIIKKISKFTENREQNLWSNIQQNYINFRTDEIEKINLYKVIVIISLLLFISIILSLYFIQKTKDKENQLIQKLNYAADEALNGYWEWHLDTDYLYLSKGWKKFLNYNESELKNNFSTFKELIHPDDLEPTMNIVNKYLKTKKGLYRAKFRLKDKSGNYKWVSAIGSIVESNENIFFGFHIDIDDLMTTKETLIAQSKAAAMGEMISLISHQFKQPLGVISVNSSDLIMSCEFGLELEKSKIINSSKSNLSQVEYLSNTIDTFRDFLKPDVEKLEVHIEKIIKSSLDIVNKSLVANSINLETDFNNTKKIKVNYSELMQVFINIINNSKDAFKINNIKNRVIKIKTLQKGNNIIIEIEDTAGGIPSDKIDNIFKPYFTTKSEYNGTGLGLYIVKTIIEEHYDGSIDVKNTDNGVIFIIKLTTLS